MKQKIVFALLLLLWPSASAFAADALSLTILKEGYKEKLAVVQKPVGSLAQTYELKLKSLQEQAQADGNLEMILAVKKEIAEFRQGKNSIPKDHADLLRLRGIYDKTKKDIEDKTEQEKQALTKAYIRSLATLQTDLTKAGKLEEAIAVKKTLDSIEASVSKSVSSPKGDLIGHWTFDEDGSDSSGYGRDAKLMGGAEIVQGKVGKGALKVAKGKFAEIAHHDDFNLNHPFTLALWVYREPGAAKESWGPIFTKADGTWRIQANSKGQSAVFHLSTLQGLRGAAAKPDAMDDGKWYHLAGVFTGYVARFYVDGRMVAESKSKDKTDLQITYRSVRIGSSSSHPKKQFNGRVDDVRIYKKVLERAEIQRLSKGLPLFDE